MEDRLHSWQQTNDLPGACPEGWDYRRGEMMQLRMHISLLDSKRTELETLNSPDEEFEYVENL